MALYTPDSLPHTPSCMMHSTGSALPIELLSTWSSWRPAKTETPPASPLFDSAKHRVGHPFNQLHTTLPPISYLDQHLSRHSDSPITPPQSDDSSQWHTYENSSLRLPPLLSPPQTRQPSPPLCADSFICVKAEPSSPPLQTQVLDWFTASTERSCQFVAEKTCEMICYLWFSNLSQSSSPSKRTRLSSERDPYFPASNPATASLQFSVSPAFIRFMQKVLDTTQISQSVLVLSLHYIYRLKARNRFTNGHAGSEYRVAIAAFMMANKFVDDNTYTNKTWSEVSGIELAELNRMEREFLLGIDFGLYVDKATYDSWLNLLKGLVLAKERESRQWHCSRWSTRGSISHSHRPPCASTSHTHGTKTRAHRARSSSPTRSFVPLSLPAVHTESDRQCPHSPHPGTKRSANDAFSPSVSSSAHPKRPTDLSLEIPQYAYAKAPAPVKTESPLEPLHSFAKMNLSASPMNGSPATAQTVWTSGRDSSSQTLTSAYRLEQVRPHVDNLYFYTLVGSPVEAESESLSKKSKLRYHQPPATTIPDYVRLSRPSMPMVIQSASVSPHESNTRLPLPRILPHFTELSTYHFVPSATNHPPQDGQDTIPAAPFANAGPPGIHFYSTPPYQQISSEHYYIRGRRL